MFLASLRSVGLPEDTFAMSTIFSKNLVIGGSLL
jgi:hypothetical protein